jgi:hypothetical protein
MLFITQAKVSVENIIKNIILFFLASRTSLNLITSCANWVSSSYDLIE